MPQRQKLKSLSGAAHINYIKSFGKKKKSIIIVKERN
jgi:hypothetical protein